MRLGMAMGALGLSVLATSCSFNPDTASLGDGDGGPVGQADAASGDGAAASGDAGGADAQSCLAAGIDYALLNIDSCDPQESNGDLHLDGDGTYTLDTDTGVLRDPLGGQSTPSFTVVTQENSAELYVLTVDSLQIDTVARLQVQGSRAMVLVALENASIEGVLTARARGASPGAGGDDDLSCALGRGAAGNIQTDENDNVGGTGGGGGAFATDGGKGASVDTASGDDAEGGEGSADLDLVPLRGGCAGGPGGDVNGGAAGNAGGAIQLIVGATLSIDGRVSTSGGGGAGADDHGGGGGGGSGGGLLLQAAAIVINGQVTANGGGGGEGSRTFVSNAGSDGRESSDTPALGGADGSAGGDGGNGGALNSPPEDGSEGELSGANAAGGGGGGGASGVIRLLADFITIDPDAVVSPAPQP